MLFRANLSLSRAAVNSFKSKAKAPRGARISVEPLEGRRLMDAGGSVGLNITAHADVHIVASQQINEMATFKTLSAQIAAKEQSVLASVHASEQTLANLAAKESLMLHQSTSAGASAAANVHAKALAELNTEIAGMKATEGSVVMASVSAQARLQAQVKAELSLLCQAAVAARQELELAAKGLTQAAASLHAKVAHEVSAAQQTQVSAQASAGASVQDIGHIAVMVTQQATQDVAAVAQLEADLSASLGGAVSVLGSGDDATSTS